MNVTELQQHYAEVRRRIAGEPKRRVCIPKIKKIEPVPTEISSKEREVIRSLAAGIPPASDDLRESVIQMLRAYRVPWMAIVGKSRVPQVVYCRRAIIWILHLRGWSTTKIGRFFGFDHSSINHALNKLNPRREKIDPYLKKDQRAATRRTTCRKDSV